MDFTEHLRLAFKHKVEDALNLFPSSRLEVSLEKKPNCLDVVARWDDGAGPRSCKLSVYCSEFLTAPTNHQDRYLKALFDSDAFNGQLTEGCNLAVVKGWSDISHFQIQVNSYLVEDKLPKC